MKRTILATAAILAAGLTAAAQDWPDALRYSDNDYEGTARTIAMGNAFTALGGDIGSLGINPAGSAVARHSQFTVSLGPDIIIGTAQGTALPDGETAFGKRLSQTGTKFSLPNIGATINFNTGSSRGLKNWSMGFVMNNTGSYSEDFTARGTNYRTSAFGALADRADNLGYTADELGASNIYDRLKDVSDWAVAAGYQSGAIWEVSDKSFAGITEYIDAGNLTIGLSGLDQRYGRTRTGSKQDFVYNLGFNISDLLYFGANVGITNANYSQSEFMREDAVSPDDFGVEFTNDDGTSTITHFTSAKSTCDYSASVAGIYGKFGFILTPWKGLRLGAAIQTPTSISVKEKIVYGAEGNYENSYYSGSAKCEGNYKYNLKAPLRANFGAAYTFGKLGLLSVDYEIVNYRDMRFRAQRSSDSSDFDLANTRIQDLCGVQHYLRVGTELKPVDFLSLRLGYTLKTNGQTYEYDGADNPVKAPHANVHTASVGLGFSTGAFFADLAAVGRFYPTEYIRPYDNYINGVWSPEISYTRQLVKIVATLGVRF